MANSRRWPLACFRISSALGNDDHLFDDDVRVTRSPDEELDQEAVKAARQWKFKPGTKDGRPVAVQVNIELTFTLKR